jgi:hypothetical protein
MTGGAQLTRGRTAVAAAAVAGLECAWLYTLLHVANQGLHLTVPIPWLFLIYAASFAWMILLRAIIRSSLVRSMLSWVGWPPATFLLLFGIFRGLTGIAHGIEETLFVVLAAGVLWWVGAHLGRGPTTYRSVVIGFQFGLLMLAASLLIGYAAHADLSAAIPIAVVFVGAGLLAAAITRTDDEGAPLFFQRGGAWWSMLLLSLALVLLLGLVAGVLFTPELMHLVARGFRGLWSLINRLLGAIAGLFPSSDPGPIPAPAPGVTVPQEPGPSFSLALPEWLRRRAAIAYGVFMGSIALLAVWRIASQLFERMRHRGDDEAQTESLRGAFRDDVAKALRRMVAWLMRLLRLGRGHARPRDESPQTASIRRLYADMLRWGTRSGSPRGSSQTPFEYQETLCLAFPGHETDIRSITEGYVRARYGAQPPTEMELNQLRESRNRLRRRGS